MSNPNEWCPHLESFGDEGKLWRTKREYRTIEPWWTHCPECGKPRPESKKSDCPWCDGNHPCPHEPPEEPKKEKRGLKLLECPHCEKVSLPEEFKERNMSPDDPKKEKLWEKLNHSFHDYTKLNETPEVIFTRVANTALDTVLKVVDELYKDDESCAHEIELRHRLEELR